MKDKENKEQGQESRAGSGIVACEACEAYYEACGAYDEAGEEHIWV